LNPIVFIWKFKRNSAVIHNDIAKDIFKHIFTAARQKGGEGIRLAAAFNAVTRLKGHIRYVAILPLGGLILVVSDLLILVETEIEALKV
jgi:hypothetical protein